MTVDVSELVAEFGAFYINEGQNMSRLMQMVRQKSVTARYAKPAITENTTFRQSESSLGEIIQAFQKAFTTKATLKFVPRVIDLYRMKIDHALFPDEVVESWVGFLEDLDKNARAQWPLIRFLIESETLPQMQDDLENKAHYKGIFVAPTAGVAGTAAGAMNGIRKWLVDGIAGGGATAGTINNLDAIGTVNQSNIFDKIEEIADQLQEVLVGEQMMLAMSPFWVRQYLRDKRNVHGVDVNYDSKKLTVDFFDNLMLVGLPSMSATNDIWMSPKRNFRYVRRSSGFKPIKVEELKREVFLMTDWWEGFGFDINEMVYAYLPSSSGSGS